MIVCDKCGKPLLLEYISVSFSAHKYMRKDLYSENFNWVHGEPYEGYHFCESCFVDFSEWLEHRSKSIEEVKNELERIE